MADVGSANIEITADDSRAKSKLSGFMGYLRNLSSTAAGIITGFTVFEGLSNTLQTVADSTIGANANMEQYENTLTTVLKSHDKAQDTLKWASKFAAQTPFEIPSIVEATTRLSAYGITAQDVLKDVGDMASVMGTPLMQAVEAVADAQTGELERLKEFGITKNMLIEQARKMGLNEVVNAKGQITDMEGLNKALFALMQERFSGGMELQSKTFKGMVSNAQDAMGTLARVLSEPVFEKLKDGMAMVIPVMGAFTTFITEGATAAHDELVGAFGQETGDLIFKVFEKIKDGADAALEFIKDLSPTIDNLKGIIKNLFPILQDLGIVGEAVVEGVAEELPGVLNGVTDVVEGFTSWEGFVPIVEGVTAATATYKFMVEAVAKAEVIWNNIKKISTALQTAYTAAMVASTAAGGGFAGVIAGVRAAMVSLNIAVAANPLVWIPAVIVGVIVALVSLYKHSETFRAAVDRLWAKMKDAWTWIVNFTEKNVVPVLRDAWKDIQAGWDNLVNFFTKTLPDAYHKFIGLFDSDTSDWEAIWGRVVDQSKKDVDDLKTLFTQDLPNAWASFNNYADELDKKGQEKVMGWVESAGGKLDEWQTSFSTWFDDTKDMIIQKLPEWKTALDNWLSDQNEENKRQFEEWKKSITDWFEGIPDSITAKMDEWGTAISNWFDGLPDRTAEKLSGWWDSISNWFTDKKEKWSENFSSWSDNISSWFTGLPDKSDEKLDNWWTSISGWVSNTKEDWKTSLEGWWTSIGEWFSTWGDRDEPKEAGKKVVKKTKDGVDEKKQEFMDNIGKIIVDAFEYALAAFGIIIIAVGRELIKRLISGVTAMKQYVSDKVSEINKAISDKVNSIDLVQAGKDAVQGLIDGLGSMLKKVKEKAKEISEAVEQAIRDKLKMKSPSRVMMVLGRDTGAGYVIGLEEMIGAAMSKAYQLGDSVTQAVSSTKEAVGNLFSFQGDSPWAKYFNAILEDGDWMNDWITHLGLNRTQMNSVMDFGKQFAALQGLTSNMIGNQAASNPGPYVFSVNLNGRTVAQEIYSDIAEMQNRSETMARRSKGEVRG